MRVALAGVEDRQLPAVERERHGIDLERGEVDAERRVGGAEQAGDLVEHPGVRADPLVLHARAEPRELHAIQPGSAGEALAGPQRAERQTHGDLERRRGGQAGAAREVAAYLQARGAQRLAGGGELGDDAAHECAPALGPLGRSQRELVALLEVARVGLDRLLRAPEAASRARA